jgi:putative transposase
LIVLGPLVSRPQLNRGEINVIIRHLAAQPYQIPHSPHTHLSFDTIKRWYLQWKRGGIEALEPKTRADKGITHLSEAVQEGILRAKHENGARSINTVIEILEQHGIVAKGTLARATVHRFLRQHNLSARVLNDAISIERRSFEAQHAGDLFHGDVLHGPHIQTPNGMRKTYLVTLLDDTSRLIAHSAFCLGETALAIEGVLKQAVLKRGIPTKLLVDNGPAYRAHTLQAICIRLEIRLVYCRPYEPEGKGKLERFHRTFREQFLAEIKPEKISGLQELNELLWAWIEEIYHQRKHGGLDDKTPLERWRDDLLRVRPLGFKAENIDDIFYHRVERRVRKDGTVNWDGMRFEVPYEHAGEKVILVIDPHAKKALRIESPEGNNLGPVTPLDVHANLNRKRQRPHRASKSEEKTGKTLVELAHEKRSQKFNLPPLKESFEEKK